MPDTLDTIPIFENPPVARYSSDHRNRPSGTMGANGSLNARRRSWQDIVAESDTATVSDISLLNHSFGDGSMGNRRQSWQNLMESEDNLHKESPKEKVSKTPSGAAKSSKPSMKLVTVADNGKLRKEHFNNVGSASQKSRNSYSSRNSTPTEFILVPKSFSSAGSLSKKMDDPDSQNSYGDRGLHQNRVCQRPIFICPCSAMKTLLFILLVAFLFGAAVVIALLVRRHLVWPKVYHFQWHGGTENGIVRLVASMENEDEAMFTVNGWPFSEAKTYVDFAKNRVVHVDPVLPNHCFAMHLNVSALNGMRSLVNAAENSSGIDLEVRVWRDDWHWTYETLPSQFREQVITSVSKICPDTGHIYWLRRNFDDQQRLKCTGCHDLCFPEYGVENNDLKILRRVCFWFYFPRWSQHSNEKVISDDLSEYNVGYANSQERSKYLNSRENHVDKWNFFGNDNGKERDPSRTTPEP